MCFYKPAYPKIITPLARICAKGILSEQSGKNQLIISLPTNWFISCKPEHASGCHPGFSDLTGFCQRHRFAKKPVRSE
jgi:hypothetical protein